MRLVYGETTCQHCSKKIYATDDPFVAEQWKGAENVVGFKSGIYHYDCFQQLECADAYCALKGAAQHRQLARPAWRVLGEDARVAIAWNRSLREYRVVFIEKGRQVTLVGSSELEEFSLLIQSISPESPMNASGSRFQLETADERWVLSVREPVSGSMQLFGDDYERLLKVLGMPSEALTGRHFDLEELFLKLAIVPTASSFPPGHAQGQVLGIDRPVGAEAVTLRLLVFKQVRVYLSQDDLRSLQQVLKAADEAAEARKSTPGKGRAVP